ncbi:hypothetical protein TNCV_4556241 [Trichonephila clavipes]|nr:hypothetical protein TNCV_4556241 [Trichonephila clavipes]
MDCPGQEEPLKMVNKNDADKSIIQHLTIKFGKYSCNINVDEKITKVTLLSFEIIPSHSHTPLRYAIDALETLQKFFFWDGVQKHCHVSLDVRNIINIDNTFFSSLQYG